MTAPGAVGPLPGADDLGGLLDGLLDRATTAHQQGAPVLPGRDVAVVASYVDADGAVRAVVLLDRPVSACLGAALALVPTQRVAEALGAPALPADLADGTREVLGVMSSLLTCGGAPLALTEVAVVPTAVDGRTVGFLRSRRRRSDLLVTVPGYGEGRVALVAG